MPAVFSERLIQSISDWVYIVSFFYGDEPFDYMFGAGSIMSTEASARAHVARQDYKRKAQKEFLRDVHLETLH